jgi:hypothetical protein
MPSRNAACMQHTLQGNDATRRSSSGHSLRPCHGNMTPTARTTTTHPRTPMRVHAGAALQSARIGRCNRKPLHRHATSPCIHIGSNRQQRTARTICASAAAAAETSQQGDNIFTRFNNWWKVGDDGDSAGVPPPGSLSKLLGTVWKLARPDASMVVLAVVFLVSTPAAHSDTSIAPLIAVPYRWQPWGVSLPSRSWSQSQSSR